MSRLAFWLPWLALLLLLGCGPSWRFDPDPATAELYRREISNRTQAM